MGSWLCLHRSGEEKENSTRKPDCAYFPFENFRIDSPATLFFLSPHPASTSRVLGYMPWEVGTKVLAVGLGLTPLEACQGRRVQEQYWLETQCHCEDGAQHVRECFPHSSGAGRAKIPIPPFYAGHISCLCPTATGGSPPPSCIFLFFLVADVQEQIARRANPGAGL